MEMEQDDGKIKSFLRDYVPHPQTQTHVTLAWAQSVDGCISQSSGAQLAISCAETKHLTHYIRSMHQAIVIGVGTAIADDPKLNCRIPGAQQPRPIVVDPHSRWVFSSKSRMAVEVDSDRALAPWLLVQKKTVLNAVTQATVDRLHGKVIPIDALVPWSWKLLIEVIKSHNVHRIMIEGGAMVINDALKERVADALIVTIAPLFVGSSGVLVSPTINALEWVTNPSWQQFGQDAVFAGQPKMLTG